MLRLPAILLALAVLLAAAPAAANEKPVLLVSGPDWAPFYMLNEASGQHTGALHDILLEACEAAGADCQVQDFPWKRGLDYLEYGEIDIICGLYSTEERQKKFIFSPSIFTDEVRIFAVNPLTVNHIKDLRGLRGDAQFGYSYGDSMDAYISQHLDITRLTDKKKSLTRLLKGNTDYLICSYLDCMQIINDNNWEGLVHALPFVLTTQDVFIAFSRHSAHPDLLRAINRELGRMVESGRAEELLEPYLPR